ncbi:MAG: polysaccharide ABC transporter ATP-binding protein [Deltaproteobacteria bacterium]|nr:polysaccharide ABC transporter ATP-binding protein [Deltaproteobacteria bacterium]
MRWLRNSVGSSVAGNGGHAQNPIPGTQSAATQTEEFWALKNVSFEVKQGEVVGIIGRNGAGKSTLLKILSRITEPTTGRVRIGGRVASLLEVGTGFHPELSGRENIFVNGAVLGMTRAEIKRKFDEIVAFAEVEKFIDTPVKRYSSGMYVRLAFAVAAHLEPEILIIDEVLAVGDAQFQKKCLGKMGEVAKGGRTVLFVSHQMNQIRRLCERVFWIDGGGLRGEGSSNDIANAYETAATKVSTNDSYRGDEREFAARFGHWEIFEPRSEKPNVLSSVGPVKVSFFLEVTRPIREGHHGVALLDSEGALIWGTGTDGVKLPAGPCELRYGLPFLPLRPGIYQWVVTIFDEGTLLDKWYCTPGMEVATAPVAHRRDECAGVLNFAYDFNIRELSGSGAS